jgi:glycosyltransferase involved in cell wall biosynthesis
MLCLYTRSQAKGHFQADTYYSPNLSLDDSYQLAFPPRRQKPWRRRQTGKPRVLLLSVAHQRGHGVGVVMSQQAAFLVGRGYDVHVGGPAAAQEDDYAGCTRVHLDDPHAAAVYAAENDIDCIIAETPPFFAVARWTGDFPRVIMYDYGEPPPSLFPDVQQRQKTLLEKFYVFAMAHRLCAISKSVKDEAGSAEMKVIPLANSHLSYWDEKKQAVRVAVRARNGWLDSVVVLNVCRFHEAERCYKGIDTYIDVAKKCELLHNIGSLVFVICGKASSEDVAYAESMGLTVKANVSDQEMIELYAAADIYANFSRWEGWNLGIAQALAFGLPVVASDIPAHRMNFAIPLVTEASEGACLIAELARSIVATQFNPVRKPAVSMWANALVPLAETIDDVCVLADQHSADVGI